LLKQDKLYLNANEAGSEAIAGIGKRIALYNQIRPHNSLSGQTPDNHCQKCLCKGSLKREKTSFLPSYLRYPE